MELPKYSESSEVLPAYAATLEYYGVCLIKTEFISPYHTNGSRGWKPVFLELNTTQLNIYELSDKKLSLAISTLFTEVNYIKEAPVLDTDDGTATFDSSRDPGCRGRSSSFASYDDESIDEIVEHKLFNLKQNFKKLKHDKSLSHLPKYYLVICDNKLLFEPNTLSNFQYKGKLIGCYTLTNMKVGLATSLNDYDGKHYNMVNVVKYTNVLRLRIEYKQILLQFWSFSAMVSWYRNLIMGKDLAVPLESRSLTKFKTIPSSIAYSNLPMLNNYNNYIYCQDSSAEKSDSEDESIFSRRGSVSTAGSCDSLSNDRSIEIQGLKLYLNDNEYTIIEKNYLLKCIPKLNSFDGWCGKYLTISNFPEFMQQECTAFDDIILEPTTLPRLILNYDKAKRHKSSLNSSCRTFVIHQDGLISVGSKNVK